MTLVWRPGFSGLTDADAIAYVAAVEAADGQALEFGVGKAINDFIVGCKLDGTWSAIKASCILAGARTLNGALVPLVGTAPNRFGTEGGWNYNRKTGLQGNGTNNYINSNRNNNADIATNHHIAAYAQRNATTQNDIFMGYRPTGNDTGGKFMGYRNTLNGTSFASTPDVDLSQSGSAVTLGVSTFHGLQRSGSTGYTSRNLGVTTNQTQTSTTAASGNIYIFGLNNGGSLLVPTTARLAFYSIGESLDLALLDTRVSALITAIGAAIP